MSDTAAPDQLRSVVVQTEEIFTEGSAVLAEHHLAFQRQQAEYARRVAVTLERGLTRKRRGKGKTAVVLLETDTGTGKTLGYAVPLAMAVAHGKQRGAISTFTLALQRQVRAELDKTVVPLVEQMTGVRLTVANRYGMANFVSYAAVAELVGEQRRKHTGGPEMDVLLALRTFAEDAQRGTASGLIQDYLEEQGLETLPLGITREQVALSAADSADDRMAYQRHVEASRNADILVVNHATLVLDVLTWFKVLAPGEAPISLLVVDEADRLPDAAGSIVSRDVPLRRAMRLLDALEQTYPKVFGTAIEAFRTLHDNLVAEPQAQEGYALLGPGENQELAGRIRNGVAVVAHSLQRPLAQVGSALEDGDADARTRDLLRELRMLSDHLDTILQSMAGQAATESYPAVQWSPVRTYPSLRNVPLNPGRILRRLWTGDDERSAPMDAVVLTSSTLGVPGASEKSRYAEFYAAIGLYRPGEESYRPNLCEDLIGRFEPSDFGRMMFILADPGAPAPSAADPTHDVDDKPEFTNEAWRDYAAGMVLRAWSSKTHRRTLVLTTSYKDTEGIAHRLAEHVPADRLIVHKPGAKLSDYIPLFEEHPDAVWITPGGWEGLNLPGLIDNLVIPRIPFAPPDEVRHAALCSRKMIFDLQSAEARQLRFGMIFNNAKRRLKQGIGRGIRSRSDKVRLWIADPRFPVPKEALEAKGSPLGQGVSQEALLSCVPQRFVNGPGAMFKKSKILLSDGRLWPDDVRK